MKTLGPVGVSAVLPIIASLTWRPSGVRPWDGSYGMLSYPWGPKVTAYLEAVINRLLWLSFPGHRRGACFLARLVPGQRVPPHVDAEDDSCRTRIHVPLITNPLATFTEAGVEHHLPAGYAYLVNPTVEHSAYNGGTTDRIHLLFNAVSTRAGPAQTNS